MLANALPIASRMPTGRTENASRAEVSRTPNLHFCAAPNPLFHSVSQFSVGGRIRLCCMQTVGQPIEWKTDIDCFVSSQ
jgi:hypothetical protein